MIRLLKIFAVILLMINGTGAIYGGVNLIMYPDGSSLGLPLSLLDGSPFSNYLIPGIVLLVANGVFSFLIVSFVLLKTRHYREYIIAEGVVLIGWLSIQIMLIRLLFVLHYVMGAVGILLVCSGLVLLKLHNRRLKAPVPAHGRS